MITRRKFLKIAGIGAAAPTVVAKAIIKKPIPTHESIRDLLADHYLDKFDKTAPRVLYG